jgi:hypothetical protein
MYIYAMSPIDAWTYWHKIEPGADAEVDKFLEEARRLAAEHAGYDGKDRDGPFVAALPPRDGYDGWSDFMVGWKQDNNGSTYIASPHPLEWLKSSQAYPR